MIKSEYIRYTRGKRIKAKKDQDQDQDQEQEQKYSSRELKNHTVSRGMIIMGVLTTVITRMF